MLRANNPKHGQKCENSSSIHSRRSPNRMRLKFSTCIYLLIVASLSLTVAFIHVGMTDFEDTPKDAPPVTQHQSLAVTHRQKPPLMVVNDTVVQVNDTADVRRENEVWESRVLPKNPELKLRLQKAKSEKATKIPTARNPMQNRIKNRLYHVIRSDKNADSLANYYTPPAASGVSRKGKPFKVSMATDQLAPPNVYLDIKSLENERFVFVTWADYGRFAALRTFVTRLQHGYKGHTIAVYDLGLLQAQLDELHTYCYVAVRKLDLSDYPEHISDLSTHAFKPVIFRAALMEFQIILWIEPELGLPLMRDQWKTMLARARHNDGWVQIKADPDKGDRDKVDLLSEFHQYLPNMVDKQNATRFVHSGAILAYNSERVYKTIIHWWFLCALDKSCFESSYSTSGCTPASAGSITHVCRHNDQTILDILTMNAYGYDMSTYSFVDTILHYATRMEKEKNVIVCDG